MSNELSYDLSGMTMYERMEFWKMSPTEQRLEQVSNGVRLPIAAYVEGLASDDPALVSECSAAMAKVRITSWVSTDFSRPSERENPRDYKVEFYQPADAVMEGTILKPKHRKGYLFGLVVIEGRKPEWKWVSRKDIFGKMSKACLGMGGEIGSLEEVARTLPLGLMSWRIGEYYYPPLLSI